MKNQGTELQNIPLSTPCNEVEEKAEPTSPSVCKVSERNSKNMSKERIITNLKAMKLRQIQRFNASRHGRTHSENDPILIARAAQIKSHWPLTQKAQNA